MNGSSSTWTWTPSSPRWRCSTTPPWPDCRSSWAARGHVAWWRPVPTRPEGSACTRPCPPRWPGGSARQRCSWTGGSTATSRRASSCTPSSNRSPRWWRGSPWTRPSWTSPGRVQLLGDGPTIAATVRRRVAEELHLACSVGVGRSKLMAKLASKAAKPSASRSGVAAGPGVVVVPPERELAFLHPLPVRALWGVGPVTGRKLESLGILTVGDLASLPVGALQRYLGTAQGAHLAELARGHDPRPVVPEQEAKSIGHEETFPSDLWDRERAPRPPPPHGGRIGHRPPQLGADGSDRHRQGPLLGLLHDHPEPLPALADRRLAGHRLGGRGAPGLGRAGPRGPTARGQPVRIRRSAERAPAQPGSRSAPVRLGGVRAGGRCRFRPGGARRRRTAWPGPRTRQSGSRAPGPRSPSAVDAIRARYGGASVGPASLVGADGLRVRRRGEAQWGPTAQTGPPIDEDRPPAL